MLQHVIALFECDELDVPTMQRMADAMVNDAMSGAMLRSGDTLLLWLEGEAATLDTHWSRCIRELGELRHVIDRGPLAARLFQELRCLDVTQESPSLPAWTEQWSGVIDKPWDAVPLALATLRSC